MAASEDGMFLDLWVSIASGAPVGLHVLEVTTPHGRTYFPGALRVIGDSPTAAPVANVITIGKANPAIGLDVPASVRNGRLMVPFRWFAERILNATVDFRVVGAAGVVSMHRDEMQVELTINSTIARVNGGSVALGVAPFATGGRTLVPARFLAETFGYVVHWNPATNEVTFTLRS